MHVQIISQTLSDGSKVYNVIVIADGEKITFACTNKFYAADLLDILTDHVSWIEID